MGVDPRGQRGVRAPGRLLDPDLHAPGDRLPARDLRRLVPHADAHGRLGGRLGEVARAEGLQPCSRSSGRAASARHARHLRPVFAWEEVRIWSRTQVGRPLPRGAGADARTWTARHDRRAGGPLRAPTCRHRHPRAGWLVDDAWVKPGAHIARSAPTSKGEQELDPRMMERGRVFVDDIRQCREGCEINVALSRRLDHRGRRRRRDRGDRRRLEAASPTTR